MGLDMYLTATKFISGYHYPNTTMQKDPLFDPLVALTGIKPPSTSPSMELTMNVAYWRKANAIHCWFVQTFQGGDDDCGKYPVTREGLERLKWCCEQVLADPEKATILLPAQSGFFFGGTDYDESYFQDLRNTISQIDAILTNAALNEPDRPGLGDWQLAYQSSW